jgi:hypothetical protein
MDDDQKTFAGSLDDQAHVGPPDLILQAIVPPTDAPLEIRAAVADALAGHTPEGSATLTWEDIGFAASAIALVEGTSQRAEPDTQWVFALSAEAPKLGEQVQATDGWSQSIKGYAYSNGTGRAVWQIRVLEVLRTAPRAPLSTLR